MVIEPVEDLHVAAVGQCPMGEVRLPTLVGLGSGEADVGAFGPFARLRSDQAVVVQDAPNRRGGGHGQALGSQMPLQGDRAGVEAVGDELFAQRDDRTDDLIAGGSRVAGGASRASIDTI